MYFSSIHNRKLLLGFAAFFAFLIFHTEAFGIAGFVNIDDPGLPSCFSDSIQYQVHRFSVYSNQPTKTIPANMYETILSNRDQFSAMERVAREVEVCAKDHVPECPIYFAGDCSAFAWKYPNSIWTNEHCFTENHIQYDFIFELSGAYSGDKRYDVNNSTAILASMGDVTMQSTDYAAPTVLERVDFINFMVTESDEYTPLESAKNPPAIGDTLYVVGYPAPTHGRRMVNPDGYDSPGKDLMVTQGKLLDPNAAVMNSVGFGSFDLGSLQKIETNKQGWLSDLYIDADYMLGMSGSPIVNDHCQLVGISRGSECPNADMATSYCKNGMFGVTTAWLNSLKSVPK